MRLQTKIAAMSAVCALYAGGALAQSQGAESTGNMGNVDADQVTCADITVMDTQLIPGALYFVAGYGEGSRAASGDDASASQSDMAQGGGSEAGSASEPETGTTTETSTTGSAGGTMSSDSGSSTEPASGAESSNGADTGMAHQSAAPNDTTSGGNTDADMAAEPGEDARMDGDQPSLVRVTGLFEIPVEEVVTFCGENQDMTVSDAVQQHRNSGGSGDSSN